MPENLTIDQLRDLARRTMDFGIDKITKDGDLCQMFYLVRADGSMDVVVVEGGITNDENAKRALSITLKARVAAEGFLAVIMLSDVFFTENLSKESDKLRQLLGLTIKQAADAGLCEITEAIIVSLESPIFYLILRQKYRRDGDCIELLGERTEEDDSSGNGIKPRRARFTGFFPSRESGIA